MYLRKNSQIRNELSIDEPLNVDWDGNELLLSDILGSDPDLVNRNIEKEAEKTLLLDCIAHLSNREQFIMCLRFGINGNKEHTQKEVADLLGISQSYISRLEKKIIKRLKKDFERAC
jgi:RNA polymerase sporulation-specific sigma factor